MVLETTWCTRTGWLQVLDVLLMGPWHHEGERSGSHAPTDYDADHVLLRDQLGSPCKQRHDAVVRRQDGAVHTSGAHSGSSAPSACAGPAHRPPNTGGGTSTDPSDCRTGSTGGAPVTRSGCAHSHSAVRANANSRIEPPRVGRSASPSSADAAAR